MHPSLQNPDFLIGSATVVTKHPENRGHPHPRHKQAEKKQRPPCDPSLPSDPLCRRLRHAWSLTGKGGAKTKAVFLITWGRGRLRLAWSK